MKKDCLHKAAGSEIGMASQKRHVSIFEEDCEVSSRPSICPLLSWVNDGAVDQKYVLRRCRDN